MDFINALCSSGVTAAAGVHERSDFMTPQTKWTNAVHGLVGNILMIDGQVAQTTSIRAIDAITPRIDDNASYHGLGRSCWYLSEQNSALGKRVCPLKCISLNVIGGYPRGKSRFELRILCILTRPAPLPHLPGVQMPTTLINYLESQLPAALKILEQMVGMNSFTGNREGVNRLGRYTAECFAEFGFSAEFVPSTNPAWGDHLVLTRRGRSTHSIAMISHLDTVFPPEEEVRNDFHWQREGDRIYGPGTHDIKGGTIVMWLMLAALRAQAPAAFEDVTWRLIWNSSEETLSHDFGEVCRSRFDRDTLAALVFESEGRFGDEHLLVVARKGRATWRVTVNGRGAHAGGKHPHGANAIVQLGQTLQQVAALTDYSRDLTVNVGTVSGGTVLNRVPHEAVAEGEFRAFTPETYAHAQAALLALAGPGEVRSRIDGYPCGVKVEILSESRPWPRNPATDRLAAIWQQTGKELGMRINVEERGGLSDGNHLWDAVPTLDGLGPWGDNDHCSERSADGAKLPEFVEATSFVPKAALNVMAVLKLLP